LKVSVVIPVYNEALAIREILTRVCRAALPTGWQKEVIVVDDGSTDTTLNLVNEFLEEHPQEAVFVRVHQSLINHGKGAALRAGFKLATGDILLVQDGDLEYSPSNYPDLLKPFENSKVAIVYGSRFLRGYPKGMRFKNLLANIILTKATRLLYAADITDEATGYKVFRADVLKSFVMKCRGFEFCSEFTAKALLAGFRIEEMAVDYDPRGILEGKKIKAKDGFIALWVLIKYKLMAVVGRSEA
jgi:dolichol-phosphate mannosyltransferase